MVRAEEALWATVHKTGGFNVQIEFHASWCSEDVEHLNGGGDGGMLNTFSSKALEGNGILGKKVEYVTGDTQTKSDAARASAKSMIEKDGAVMITGGSSSGVAVAVQGCAKKLASSSWRV